jgi:hypothetical protein
MEWLEASTCCKKQQHYNLARKQSKAKRTTTVQHKKALRLPGGCHK